MMSTAKRHAVVPIYLAACLLLGGASAAGAAANLLLQLCALPMIGWALWELSGQRLTPAARSLFLLLAALLLVLLLQLVPLPPSIWTRLPGRDTVAAGYRLLALPLPWLPISLTPAGTIASAVWLLPAIAVLFGMVVLGAFRTSWLGVTLLSAVGVGVALGTLQLVGGPSGGAYLYRFSNWGQAVGFFANSNHMATLLVVCIPFLFALRQAMLQRSRSRQRASAVHVLIWASFAVLVVGLVTNMSLAGLGLSVPVSMLSLLGFRTKAIPYRRILIGAAALLSVVGMASVALLPTQNLFGQQSDHAELSRRTSFVRTIAAARDYLPFGSGVGSFQSVYRTQEPLSEVTTTYMNHAHSDWLEILLETGIVGVLLAAAFLAWWSRRVLEIWRAAIPDYFSRAATIASGAMLLHSMVDYPLRTAALSAVFAMCLALMSDVRPFIRRARTSTKAREVTI